MPTWKRMVLCALAVLACASARDGKATGDDGPCESDAGCALTQVASGECCPMLCTPRAVTERRAAELEAKTQACNGGRGCPLPSCAPSKRTFVAACVERRCVAKPVPAD